MPNLPPATVSFRLFSTSDKDGEENSSRIEEKEGKSIETGSQSLDFDRRATHTVTWLKPTNAMNTSKESPPRTTQSPSFLSFPVFHGETLRTATLRSGLASPHNGRANLINCRGLEEPRAKTDLQNSSAFLAWASLKSPAHHCH